MKEESKWCIHCTDMFDESDPFKEGEHIIVIPDGLLHYDCFDEYLGNRYYSHEAIIKDGRVVEI